MADILSGFRVFGPFVSPLFIRDVMLPSQHLLSKSLECPPSLPAMLPNNQDRSAVCRALSSEWFSLPYVYVVRSFAEAFARYIDDGDGPPFPSPIPHEDVGR